MKMLDSWRNYKKSINGQASLVGSHPPQKVELERLNTKEVIFLISESLQTLNKRNGVPPMLLISFIGQYANILDS